MTIPRRALVASIAVIVGAAPAHGQAMALGPGPSGAADAPARAAATASGLRDAGTLCVFDPAAPRKLRETSILAEPTTGDTFAVVRPTDRPIPLGLLFPARRNYVTSRPWFDSDAPLSFAGRSFRKHGGPVVLPIGEMRPVGTTADIWLFARNPASEPDVLYAASGPGCEFQPYRALSPPVRGARAPRGMPPRHRVRARLHDGPFVHRQRTGGDPLHGQPGELRSGRRRLRDHAAPPGRPGRVAQDDRRRNGHRLAHRPVPSRLRPAWSGEAGAALHPRLQQHLRGGRAARGAARRRPRLRRRRLPLQLALAREDDELHGGRDHHPARARRLRGGRRPAARGVRSRERERDRPQHGEPRLRPGGARPAAHPPGEALRPGGAGVAGPGRGGVPRLRHRAPGGDRQPRDRLQLAARPRGRDLAPPPRGSASGRRSRGGGQGGGDRRDRHVGRLARGLGHADFAESPAVLGDLYLLLRGRTPAQRALVQVQADSGRSTYWTFPPPAR